ncbi:hypothetical protein KKH27_03045 [bacterium]|nr:hypothetical protein [bacterium]MBU1983042.1 hypothetical protein [bacterium]
MRACIVTFLLLVLAGLSLAQTSPESADSVIRRDSLTIDRTFLPSTTEPMLASVWDRMTPDTTRTDMAGAFTNLGYVMARGIGNGWQFLWNQVTILLDNIGEFLVRVLPDNDRGENILRVPLSKRK